MDGETNNLITRLKGKLEGDIAEAEGRIGDPGAPAAPGATIEGVLSGSPAAGAGLASGDTITSVGGHAVASSTSLRDVMDELHPAQKVTVSWVDQYGSPYKATIELTAGPTG